MSSSNATPSTSDTHAPSSDAHMSSGSHLASSNAGPSKRITGATSRPKCHSARGPKPAANNTTVQEVESRMVEEGCDGAQKPGADETATNELPYQQMRSELRKRYKAGEIDKAKYKAEKAKLKKLSSEESIEEPDPETVLI